MSSLIFAAIVPLLATDDPATAVAVALAGLLAILVGHIEVALGPLPTAQGGPRSPRLVLSGWRRVTLLPNSVNCVLEFRRTCAGICRTKQRGGT